MLWNYAFVKTTMEMEFFSIVFTALVSEHLEVAHGVKFHISVMLTWKQITYNWVKSVSHIIFVCQSLTKNITFWSLYMSQKKVLIPNTIELRKLRNLTRSYYWYRRRLAALGLLDFRLQQGRRKADFLNLFGLFSLLILCNCFSLLCADLCVCLDREGYDCFHS